MMVEATLAVLLRRAGITCAADASVERGLLGRWAASGGMSLTGHGDGPPIAEAAGVLGAAEEAAGFVAALGGDGALARELPGVLFGRAALHGWTRSGRASAGGHCRLLRAADGWVAVSLARPRDVDAVGAIVGDAVEGDPWEALAAAAARHPAAEIADRAQIVGVPAGALPATPVAVPEPFAVADIGPRGPARDARGALVVDLSAMWAGPLCAALLRRAGATVVKVEDPARPDGTRRGPQAFFDLLHGGHRSLAVDFHDPASVAVLRDALARADVVIEASRPRALRQLGIHPADVVGRGATWVSITGYGREGDRGQRVAFGDDAAVAGGLVAHDDGGLPVFCADAIADPLTGLYAAAAALAARRDGGGRLVAVAMEQVAAHAAAHGRRQAGEQPCMRKRQDHWEIQIDGRWTAVRAPVAPVPAARGPELGAPVTQSCSRRRR